MPNSEGMGSKWTVSTSYLDKPRMGRHSLKEKEKNGMKTESEKLFNISEAQSICCAVMAV